MPTHLQCLSSTREAVLVLNSPCHPQLGWLRNQRMDGWKPASPKKRRTSLKLLTFKSSPVASRKRWHSNDRWSPFWMILAAKICFKSGVKEVSGAASAMFMWCWNYTSAQSKTQPKSDFHNYAANPSFSIIATPSKRFLLATSHTSSHKTKMFYQFFVW